MKKIYILLVFLFISCGSVTKDKTSIETEINSELNASSNTARWINSNNYSLEPVDLTKPMLVTNSKGETETFTNTKFYYNNTHTKETVRDTVSKDERVRVDADQKNKETDNQTIWLMFFGFLIVVILVFKN